MNNQAHTTRGQANRLNARRRRAFFVAAFGLFGATTFTHAQAPTRSATLLPPQVLTENEARTIYRGAIDDGPSLDKFATTPVPVSTRLGRPASGPAWLNGPAPKAFPETNSGYQNNVRPVANSGTGFPLRGTVVNASVTSESSAPDGAALMPAQRPPSFFNRGFDKLRSVFVSERPTPMTRSISPNEPSLPPREMPLREMPARQAPIREMPIRETMVRTMPTWDMPQRNGTPNSIQPSQPAATPLPPRTMAWDTAAREAPPRETPSANSPLQGVSPSGAPVLAGPPAYRWYGYGTTTPGSNPYSPSGQYPRASANWYSLTGATPGAFPVPVTNPQAGNPGVDPPAYRPQSTARIVTVPSEPVVQAPYTPSAQQLAVATPTFYSPAPGTNPSAVNPAPMRTLPPAPTTTSMKPAPAPVPMPTMPPVTTPLLPKMPDAHPVSATPSVPSRPLAVAPPANTIAVSTLPRITDVPAITVPSVTLPSNAPAPLPLLTVTPIAPLVAAPKAVTAAPSEDHSWQTVPDRSETENGWAPSDGIPRQQSRATEADVKWQSQAVTRMQQIVARGQVGDSSPVPDQVAAFIRGMLQNRADAVEVRWTGSRRITVCFEVATNRDGSRLVQEISSRQELAPYHIDFCVLVK